MYKEIDSPLRPFSLLWSALFALVCPPKEMRAIRPLARGLECTRLSRDLILHYRLPHIYWMTVCGKLQMPITCRRHLKAMVDVWVTLETPEHRRCSGGMGGTGTPEHNGLLARSRDRFAIYR